MRELTPDAARVRDALPAIAQMFSAGDLRWQARLLEVSEWAERIEDPYSRDDARMRVALMQHHAVLHAGDVAGARSQLDVAEGCLERLGAFVADDDARRRHADQEWALVFTRAQLEQAVGDFERAAELGQRCLDLAPDTLDPAGRLRRSITLAAASALASEDFVGAVAGYERAVELFRREEPQELSTVMTGLAQAYLMAGRLDDAERAAARAEGLAPAALEEQLALRQVRAHIGMLRQHEGSAAGLAAYADSVDERASARHRDLAAHARVAALHVDASLVEARQAATEHLAEMRAERGPDAVVRALSRLAAVTQDLALATGGEEGLHLHHAALASLDEAAALAADGQFPLQLPRIRAVVAEYVAQWHQHIDGTNIQLLRTVLDQAREAAASLQHYARSAANAADRRDLALQYSEHAVAVAFDLAFRLGEQQMLGEMIEARAGDVVLPVGVGEP